MSLPFVQIDKTDGSLGVPTQSSPVGILALISPRVQGPSTPVMQTKQTNILSLCGNGLTTEIASYVLAKTKKPVVIVQKDPTTPGSIGSFAYVGSGSASGFVTAHSGAQPVDDLLVHVLFVNGGTLGVTGITYQYSIDARAFADPAKVWSPIQSLGTALTILIPNTGVQVDITTAKTVVAGDYFIVQCAGPKLSDSDVLAALTLLGRSSLPWECVLVEGIDASSTTISNADTFLEGIEANGKYKMFIAGARLRHISTGETEAQYLTAMQTAWGSVASIRGCVTGDGGYLTSPVRGLDIVRKADIAYAAQLMSIPLTVDAAQVDLGPLGGVRIVDSDGNTQYHDEDQDPGLDDLRLTTFRTFASKIGVFITNPKVISTPGSDYVLAQQVRTMNRVCEVAFGVLTDELSKGIFTDKKTGFIREDSAQSLESPVNNAIYSEVGKQVVFVGFELSRDDVFIPPTAVLTGEIQLVMPTYVKGFKVNALFKRTVTVST